MNKKMNVSESEVRHYIAPELQGKIVGMKEQALRPQTVEDIEELQKKAYEEARKDGYKKGLEEAKVKVNQLQKIFNFLQHPLEELDKEVEQQLAEFSLLLAKQLFKKDCAIDASHIQNLVNESLTFLPVKSRNIRVRLNPADIELMKASEMNPDEQSWKCVSDPSVTVGGCFVETDTSHLDASVEIRVQQLVDQLNLHQSAGES